jgi:hypothetical protein
MESEMETSTDILHICALAKGTTYFRDEQGSSSRSISTTSLGDQSIFSSEAGEFSGSLSLRLHQTMQQVNDTFMNHANQNLSSFDRVATKRKSQRSKLSRASTVCIQLHIERY